MKIDKFEDMKAWQEARELVRMVFSAAKNSKMLSHDFRFRDQLTSSAVSVMANIAEGFSRRSNKEFIQFLFIAKGSASELQSHLYAALDQQMIDRPLFDKIYSQADTVACIISGFITYLLKHTNSTNAKNSMNPTTSINTINTTNAMNSTNSMNSKNATN